MIIWAGSFPRSGSTLWRIAWHAYTGLPTYSYANDPMLNRITAVGQKKLPRPAEQMWRFENRPGIYMVKTHTHPSKIDPNNISRKMFIVRDVRDTVVSLAHYTSWRKRLDFASELDRIVHNTQWLHFCNAWQPAARIVVKYEELRADPRGMVEKAIDALNIPAAMQNGTAPTFAALHKQFPLFFRQGQVGRWRQFLSKAQEATLWEQFGWKMEELGYERGQA